MLPLWTPLWLNLEITSSSLVLIIIVCFTVAAVASRVLVSPMENITCTVIEPKPQMAQSMTVLRNPFTLVLEENQLRDGQLENGVTVKITSDKPFKLTSYWGTNITQFHSSLKLDWKQIRQSIAENTFLVQDSIDSSEPEIIDPPIGEALVKTFKPNQLVTPEMLGTSPRSCYPLVVILSIVDEDDEMQNRDGQDKVKEAKGDSSGASKIKKNDAIVCLISVIHVRDNICPMDTNIITQLTKLKSGNVISLQSLYTPGSTVEDGSRPITMCVICQDKSISRALLPCRHACVCGECYSLIDKCPLCRSYIRSFFLIGEERKLNQSQEEDEAKRSEQQKEPSTIRKRFGFLSRAFKSSSSS